MTRVCVALAALVAALVVPLLVFPSRSAGALHPFTPETLTVPARSIEGVDTTQTLHPGTVYRAVASGVFVYGHNSGQLADVECTMDTTRFNPTSQFEPPLPAWNRYRFTFLGPPDPTQPYNLYNSDFRDPDPRDDPIDLYVDNRNVEWQPVDVRNARTSPNPLGCHDGDPGKGDRHTYEVYFTPTHTGPVNFRIFDIYYEDNGELSGVPGGPPTVEVRVSQVAGVGLPVERHVETVLVAAEGGPVTSTALEPGKDYLLVAHGMWSYRGEFFLADAECTRYSWDSTYRRNRFGFGSEDTGELWIDGAQVEWEPVVPAQVKSRLHQGQAVAASRSDCDATTHHYTTEVAGSGLPLTFHLSDPEPETGPETGHLSVDIYEV